jgi:glucokinase
MRHNFNMAKKLPRNIRSVLAVDIGGTKIFAALFSPAGKMLASVTRPTLADEGVNAVVDRLGSTISGLLNDHHLHVSQLAGIAIACAGGIDTGRGVVVTPSPNMPDWSDVPLADIVREKFSVNAFILNDASAAALGEHRYGVGRGLRNLVLFTLGTGIGGGIIIQDELYLGAVGGAGELGHMTVAADGPKCGCGNTGCLEMFASGRAVVRDAIARLRRGASSSLEKMVGGDIEKITAEQVGTAARRGDPLACDIISRAAYYLGIGLVNAVNIFNPEMVIIGGGMAGLGDMLLAPGRQMIAARAFSVSSGTVRVVTAQLGNEAGVYGAAAFVLDRVT